MMANVLDVSHNLRAVRHGGPPGVVCLDVHGRHGWRRLLIRAVDFDLGRVRSKPLLLVIVRTYDETKFESMSYGQSESVCLSALRILRGVPQRRSLEVRGMAEAWRDEKLMYLQVVDERDVIRFSICPATEEQLASGESIPLSADSFSEEVEKLIPRGEP